MYDCSLLPMEENIRRTKDMVKKAHAAGCSLEAEIGHVGFNERSVGARIADSVYTDPKDAQLFCEETGCDALAVSIGTAHGLYDTPPALSFDALRRIRDLCDTPLVLHGGSGLSEEDFRRCVLDGISKINIFTRNNLSAARAAVQNFSEKTGAFELMAPIEAAVRQETMRHIRMFGSAGRA